jgi:hypothetical protein
VSALGLKWKKKAEIQLQKIPLTRNIEKRPENGVVQKERKKKERKKERKKEKCLLMLRIFK